MCPDGKCLEIEPTQTKADKEISAYNAASIESGKMNQRGQAYLACTICGDCGWHGPSEWPDPVCPFCRIRGQVVSRHT